MVKSFGPLLPFRALNPSNGILDVPVTNCTDNTVTMVTRVINTNLKETQSLLITEILNDIPEQFDCWVFGVITCSGYHHGNVFVELNFNNKIISIINEIPTNFNPTILAGQKLSNTINFSTTSHCWQK